MASKSIPNRAAVDYTTYTVAQLKAMLDERGINYTSSMLKADLIALLEEDDANG